MDELLKEDSHKKLKTFFLSFSVVVLACLCVVPSLCFYINFSEWFKYNASKEEIEVQFAQIQQQFKDRKTELELNYTQRRKECEDALSGYIEKFTQTTNAMEGVIAEQQKRIDSLQRKISEIVGIEDRYSEQTNALYIALQERKISEDAAAESKKKLDSLNTSIEAEKLNLTAVEKEKLSIQKQSREEAERYAQMRKQLDEDYNSKKQELTDQINRYLERFQSTTNLMERVIADRQHRLDGLVEQLEKLPDIETRYIAQTNALSNAISQRDAALKEVRESQNSFTEWNGKVGAARAEISELEGRKSAIEASISELTKEKGLLAGIRKQKRLKRDAA